MRKMRTINEALTCIKEMDTDSAVTSNGIRNLCKDGKIHCVLIGNRYLLDLDSLFEFLFG